MKKYLAGHFNFCGEGDINYYTDDFITFYKDNDEELSIEDLKEWAVWLNSPWSLENEKYELEYDYDGFTYTKLEDLLWKCKYTVVGYEYITTSVIGYANTQIDALINCIKNFNLLQNKYNIGDESY